MTTRKSFIIEFLFPVLIIATIVSVVKFSNVSLRGLEDSKELTETQKLRADLLIARAQLAQCNTKLSEMNLSIEQQKLLTEFRAQLGAKEGDQFDWQNKVFLPSNSIPVPNK